jgi:homoserine kinase
LTADRENRCIQGIEAALREVRGEIPEGVGWRLEMHNDIPLARGLGSSAAGDRCGPRGRQRAARRAADEPRPAPARDGDRGPPDNAAAALLGGFTVAARVDEGVEALRFDAPRDLRAVLFIPELRLATTDMRGALPDKVPLEDAVSNLTRVAVGVAGMAIGRFDLLRVLTVDKLHEPYRAKAFPQLPRFVADARTAGAIGACLSGAGSTIIAFTDTMSGVTRLESAFRAASADTDLAGRIEVVAPRNTGAKIV